MTSFHYGTNMKLEKIIFASAVGGAATTIILTVSTVSRLIGMPEDTMIESKDVASLMIKCYSPIFVGVMPATYFAARELYKILREFYG